MTWLLEQGTQSMRCSNAAYRSEKDEEVRWKAIATIARLLAMDYSETNVQQAIQHRGCDFDAALEWLLDHEMSEYADEDVFATSRTDRDVKVKVPAVTHNERWWFNSSDSDHNHHQEKEEEPIQITRVTSPDRRNNVVTSQPNIRTCNSHESSSLPSPRRRTKVVELQDNNDEAQQKRGMIVRRLCDIGYSSTAVGQALNHVGANFDEALNWLLDRDNSSSSTEEEDDSDWVIEEELTEQNNSTSIESALSPSKIEMQLYSLGYSIEVVGRTLNQVGSEFDAALNWLLDHYVSAEDNDNVVIAAESHCSNRAAYSSFENSSSMLHQRLQVDDLSLHSKQQQPMIVTTPLQHFNDDSPSSVDRREQRHHTSKECNDVNKFVDREKTEEEVHHHNLTVARFNFNHSDVNNGASGLLSSISNEYVVDAPCIQSKNVIIESDQEAHGNTNVSTEVVSLECLHHNSLKSEDSLQPIGIIFVALK